MSAEQSKEAQILKAMKVVLTSIIKETATEPGFKHPLSDNTKKGMRDCLLLISQREQELAEASGETMEMRPRFKDEPTQNSDEVVVSIDSIKGRRDQ